MNLLLFIKYPSYFSRVIVTGTDSVLSAIESTNDRICLCENVSALNKMERIFSGEVEPLVDYLAGNSYFGKVSFKFTRKDKKTNPERVYELSVKVFSALGVTIEEHDERYKRIKTARLQTLTESNQKANV